MLAKIKRIDFRESINIKPPGRPPTVKDHVEDVIAEVHSKGIFIGEYCHCWANITGYEMAPEEDQPLSEELEALGIKAKGGKSRREP